MDNGQYDLEDIRAKEAREKKQDRLVFVTVFCSLVGAMLLYTLVITFFPPFRPMTCMSADMLNGNVRLSGNLSKYQDKIHQICFDLEKEN